MGGKCENLLRCWEGGSETKREIAYQLLDRIASGIGILKGLETTQEQAQDKS